LKDLLKMINLSQYQHLIHLDDDFSIDSPFLTEEEELKLVELLLKETVNLNQIKQYKNRPLTAREQLYARLITGNPFLLSDVVLKKLDVLFAHEKSKKKYNGNF